MVKASKLRAGMVMLTEDMEDNEIRVRLDSVTPGNGIVRWTGTVLGDGTKGDGYFDENSSVEIEG